MAKCYVKAFFDWIEQTAALEDDERGRLFIAILEYARSGAVPDLAGREAILFPSIKSQIDRDLKNSAVCARNGKNGGKKKNANQVEPNRTKVNQNEPGHSKQMQDEPNETKANQNAPKCTQEKEEGFPPCPPPSSSPGPPLSPTPYNPPSSEEKEAPAPERSTKFDLFWQAYPKKVGKEAARKAFSRVKVPIESLLTAIERQKCGNQWLTENGRFVPNPATWLNQGRWEDDVTPAAPAAKPGYGVQGHHDPLHPLERAAVDRVMGVKKWQRGVQGHGDDLSAFQQAAIDRMLNEEDET